MLRNPKLGAGVRLRLEEQRLPQEPEAEVTINRERNERQNALQRLRALLSPRHGPGGAAATEDHILSILASRRGREARLGRHLFSDPAWDVLLELYAAKLGGRRIALLDLAKSIDIPQSTAARWITALAERGLVVSQPDPGDPSRLWIELSTRGASEMKRLIDYWGLAFRSI